MLWFQRKINDIVGVNRTLLMRESEKTSGTMIGQMVMFYYDPKYKKKLPYYDRFPVSIIFDITRSGFMGLNLHYLPIDLRATFLQGLLRHVSDEKFDKNTKFEITYDYLKSVREMRYFKPCLKKYLNKFVEGNIARINASDYEIATFLPTESFMKKTKRQVHKISREMVG